MSEELEDLLIRCHKKLVDLDRCTCWACVRKRWRNISPYPCIHVRLFRRALTCLRAWMHLCPIPSLLSWVVYVRAHQITPACLREPAAACRQPRNRPAGNRAVCSKKHTRIGGTDLCTRKYIGSAASAESYINLSETRSTWLRTTFVRTTYTVQQVMYVRVAEEWNRS